MSRHIRCIEVASAKALPIRKFVRNDRTGQRGVFPQVRCGEESSQPQIWAIHGSNYPQQPDSGPLKGDADDLLFNHQPPDRSTSPPDGANGIALIHRGHDLAVLHVDFNLHP